MATFTTTLPCKISYTWNPEEPETKYEPCSPEEFIVDSIMVAGLELITPVSSFFDTDLEDAIYEALKGSNDE